MVCVSNCSICSGTALFACNRSRFTASTQEEIRSVSIHSSVVYVAATVKPVRRHIRIDNTRLGLVCAVPVKPVPSTDSAG